MRGIRVSLTFWIQQHGPPVLKVMIHRWLMLRDHQQRSHHRHRQLGRSHPHYRLPIQRHRHSECQGIWRSRCPSVWRPLPFCEPIDMGSERDGQALSPVVRGGALKESPDVLLGSSGFSHVLQERLWSAGSPAPRKRQGDMGHFSCEVGRQRAECSGSHVSHGPWCQIGCARWISIGWAGSLLLT
jgi:hypothetical protein